MNDLIAALTRAANAVAEHYERSEKNGTTTTIHFTPTTAVDPVISADPVMEPKASEKKRGRPPKAKETAAPKEHAAPVVEPGIDVLGIGASSASPCGVEEAPTPDSVPSLTEDESKREAEQAGFSLVRHFSKSTGRNDAKGNPIPEGYDIAKQILAEEFKAGRIGELDHAQRVRFIGIVKDRIAKAS